MKSFKSIPVPRNISENCEVDPRGLPVPFVVLKDKDGVFHFKVNDSEKTLRCLMGGLCTICGQHMNMDNRWLVGGIASAFDPHGVYIDHPVHKDCGVYALQVCPYLASRNYNAVADLDKLKDKISGAYELVNLTVDPDRVPFFVLVRPKEITYRRSQSGIIVVPVKPYAEVEYWDAGERITDINILISKLDSTKWEKYSKSVV